nr:MAG TPA: hypothetical protein [Caudoviricetes sp.]
MANCHPCYFCNIILRKHSYKYPIRGVMNKCLQQTRF